MTSLCYAYFVHYGKQYIALIFSNLSSMAKQFMHFFFATVLYGKTVHCILSNCALLLASSTGLFMAGSEGCVCGGGVPPHYTWWLAGGSYALLAYQRGGVTIHLYVILAIAIPPGQYVLSR